MTKSFVGIDPMDENQALISANVKYDFFFTEEIDEKAMLDAAVKTRECYDLLQVRVVIKDEQIFYEKNERPVKILHLSQNEPVRFADEKTNYYPWFVSVNGKLLTFVSFHGLTDGKGRFEMTRTLLWFYAQNTGLKISNNCGIITENSHKDLLPSDYISNLPQDAEPLPTYPLFKPSLINKACLDDNYNDDLHFTKIKINSAQFMKKVKELYTTPYALMTLLMFRGFKPLMMDKVPNIQGQIIISLRAVFGISTLHNCVDFKDIQFDFNKMETLPDDILCTILRSRLDIMLDRNIAIQTVKDRVEESKKVNSIMPFYKRQKDYTDNLNKICGPDAGAGVFWMSYIGRMGLPEELNNHISDMNLHLDCKLNSCPAMFEIYDYNGYFHLTCMHHLKDNTLFDGIIQQLNDYNIENILSDQFDQAHFGMDIHQV